MKNGLLPEAKSPTTHLGIDSPSMYNGCGFLCFRGVSAEEDGDGAVRHDTVLVQSSSNWSPFSNNFNRFVRLGFRLQERPSKTGVCRRFRPANKRSRYLVRRRPLSRCGDHSPNGGGQPQHGGADTSFRSRGTFSDPDSRWCYPTGSDCASVSCHCRLDAFQAVMTAAAFQP